MAGLSDIQLIQDYVRSGEIQHFDDLVRRHIGGVRAMIYPMVLNDADADELTQEVFIRVMKGISGFKMRSQFSSWLYRIAMNTTHSFLRSKMRNRVHHNAELPERIDPQGDPHARLSKKELGSQIESALSQLSPRLRAAMVLVGIKGMNPRDAAEAEGCATATMYWRVHEARRILKGFINVEM